MRDMAWLRPGFRGRVHLQTLSVTPHMIALLIIGVLLMIPALGLLVTSVRTDTAADTRGWWTGLLRFWEVDQWTISNCREVLSGGMGTAFVNSIVVAVPATIIPILIAAFAASAFTFMRFPGRVRDRHLDARGADPGGLRPDAAAV